MAFLFDQRGGFVNLLRVPIAKIEPKQIMQHRLRAAPVDLSVERFEVLMISNDGPACFEHCITLRPSARGLYLRQLFEVDHQLRTRRCRSWAIASRERSVRKKQDYQSEEDERMPLTRDMVKAATELYDQCFPEWQLCNSSLGILREGLPNWDEKSCLIKAAAINQLYGTNVYQLVPLARSISEKMLNASAELEQDLVEVLSIHPTTKAKHISFSSKLCHFFVDPKKYCIFDGAACETLEHSLGPKYVSNKHNPYSAFRKNLELIRNSSPGLNVSDIDGVALDRFLWLFGLWQRLRNGAKINAEAKRIFGSPPEDIMRRFIPGRPRVN